MLGGFHLAVISLLMTGLPLVLIAFIVMAAVRNKKEGEQDMFRQLYVYLVLFATLMMSIGGGIGVFMGAADLISPSNVYYERYDDYKTQAIEEAKQLKTEFDEEQVRKDYERMLKEDENNAKREARNTIINSLGFIIIPFPIFLYFNKIRKKKEGNQE